MVYLTCDQQVAGSNSGHVAARQQLWKSCLHTCASVTKRYDLVRVKKTLHILENMWSVIFRPTQPPTLRGAGNE